MILILNLTFKMNSLEINFSLESLSTVLYTEISKVAIKHSSLIKLIVIFYPSNSSGFKIKSGYKFLISDRISSIKINSSFLASCNAIYSFSCELLPVLESLKQTSGKSSFYNSISSFKKEFVLLYASALAKPSREILNC